LFVGPGIEVDGLNSADVSAHATVDARASDTDKDAQVPAGPSRIWSSQQVSNIRTDGLKLTLVPFAIGADLIGLQLDETLESSCVLRRPLSGGVRGSPGHNGNISSEDAMQGGKIELSGGFGMMCL
jgi:hypothetical protein